MGVKYNLIIPGKKVPQKRKLTPPMQTGLILGNPLIEFYKLREPMKNEELCYLPKKNSWNFITILTLFKKKILGNIQIKDYFHNTIFVSIKPTATTLNVKILRICWLK